MGTSVQMCDSNTVNEEEEEATEPVVNHNNNNNSANVVVSGGGGGSGDDDTASSGHVLNLTRRRQPNSNDGNEDVVPKKRRARRRKSKRKPVSSTNNKSDEVKVVNKPEAPYNSNQFLLEDHGNIDELDLEKPSRHRDSSFSVDGADSDGDEFYSSPDDEQQFLIRDFVDQYETLQAERFQTMSKAELIQEYLVLESRVEELTKSRDNHVEATNGVGGGAGGGHEPPQSARQRHLQGEIDRLMSENDRLRREIDALRNSIRPSTVNQVTIDTDSEDSETDSSDCCSTDSSLSGTSSSNSTNNVTTTSPTYLDVAPPSSST